MWEYLDLGNIFFLFLVFRGQTAAAALIRHSGNLPLSKWLETQGLRLWVVVWCFIFELKLYSFLKCDWTLGSNKLPPIGNLLQTFSWLTAAAHWTNKPSHLINLKLLYLFYIPFYALPCETLNCKLAFLIHPIHHDMLGRCGLGGWTRVWVLK